MTAKTPFPQVGVWTPGPWRVEEGTTLVWGACDPDDRTTYGMGYPVADMQKQRSWCGAGQPTIDTQVANARLIAAAPELLEALRDMLTCSQPQDSTKPGFVYVAEAQEKAAAAIKKATQP